jgi:MPBQ/MSBQ methyltransferase
MDRTKSGPSSDPPARCAAYVDAVLGEWERARPPAHEAFLHLGHWADPPRGRPDKRDFAAAQARLNDAVLAVADARDGERILDVGCGAGATLAVLAEKLPRAELVGVNVDPRQLALAEALRGRDGRVRWIAADARALPFPDASFDRVLAIECAFHFGSRARFFAEAARVLAPSGRLAVSDFVATPRGRERAAAPAFPAFAVKACLEAGFGSWPDPFGAEGDPTDLAAAAGFELSARVDVGRNVAPSFRCLLPEPCRLDALGDLDRALYTLAWLFEQGHFSMEIRAYDRR